jgi:hypothetical protein
VQREGCLVTEDADAIGPKPNGDEIFDISWRKMGKAQDASGNAIEPSFVNIILDEFG